MVEKGDRASHVLLGVVCAGAVLAKHQGAYFVTGAALVLAVCTVLRVGRSKRVNLRRIGSEVTGPLLTGTVGLLLTQPHFLKNAIYYHNPFYPLAQRLFDSVPSHERSLYIVENMYAVEAKFEKF